MLAIAGEGARITAGDGERVVTGDTACANPGDGTRAGTCAVERRAGAPVCIVPRRGEDGSSPGEGTRAGAGEATRCIGVAPD